MLVVRYTAWDGTQQVRLTAEQAFDKLSELLSYTDDVQQALDWLLHQGVEVEGIRVLGLDDLLEQLREAMRGRYRDVNLRPALAEMREKLQEVMDLEREALDGLEGQDAARERAARKRAFLDQLPPRLSDALSQLADYEFEDAEAAAAYEALRDELENLARPRGVRTPLRRSLPRSARARLRRGARAHARDGSVEAPRGAAAGGNARGRGRSQLGELLGPQALRSFQLLQGMMQALAQAGYVTQREGRAGLSPKGVRRIGQLALRDIYQGLLRDRPGGHVTDSRGLTVLRPDETRPYRFGDPLALHLVNTLKKAVARRPGTPLALEPDDFEVYAADQSATSSTVLLLDMSWSMSWRVASPRRRRSPWRWRA